MDVNFVTHYFEERIIEFSKLSGEVIICNLNLIEYKDIEDIKDELFKKRLDYFVLAKCLKERMLLESKYKQLKRYLVSIKGMESDEAQLCANKYNRACKTYERFSVIIKNISAFPKIDIRDLNINQLHMAVNMDWLQRHNSIQHRMDRISKDPSDIHNSIDWADVETSLHHLRTSEWYKKALSNPSEMAYIFNSISCRAIQDAQHSSTR